MRRLRRTFVAAVLAFVLPVIIVGGIIGGIFTPTEAAAVAVLCGNYHPASSALYDAVDILDRIDQKEGGE